MDQTWNKTGTPLHKKKKKKKMPKSARVKTSCVQENCSTSILGVCPCVYLPVTTSQHRLIQMSLNNASLCSLDTPDNALLGADEVISNTFFPVFLSLYDNITPLASQKLIADIWQIVSDVSAKKLSVSSFSSSARALF